MIKKIFILGVILLMLVGCTEVQVEESPADDVDDNHRNQEVPETNEDEVVEEDMLEQDDVTTKDEPIPIPEEVEEISNVKEFKMTAKNWEFIPDTITVNHNDIVKLEIESIDVTHGFALNAFGINENLKPGETVNIEFVADKKGEFQFFCSVFCGSGHSHMDGKLIVE